MMDQEEMERSRSHVERRMIVASKICKYCTDDDHDWCDRIMKTRGECTCTNSVCSLLNNEKYSLV